MASYIWSREVSLQQASLLVCIYMIIINVYSTVIAQPKELKHFENLCVARCKHDYGLRTSLAKELEGQMSIVTQLPDISAQSRAFISGRSKVHGIVTYIHK